MKRFVIAISYKGRNYHGWQIQPNAMTIQEKIERKLSKIAKQKITIVGSGRTDAGVNALSQIANFDLPFEISSEKLVKALKIADDIKIWNAVTVDDNFHARFDAISRSYIYKIAKEKNPFNFDLKSFFPKTKINLDKIRYYLEIFQGKHDFRNFSKKNIDLNNYFCDVEYINFSEKEDEFVFEIRANRFLHNLVRRIIGTCIYFSEKNLDRSILEELLKGKKNDKPIIKTAPSNGLYLSRVVYPESKLSKKFQDEILQKHIKFKG